MARKIPPEAPPVPCHDCGQVTNRPTLHWFVTGVPIRYPNGTPGWSGPRKQFPLCPACHRERTPRKCRKCGREFMPSYYSLETICAGCHKHKK